MSSTESAAAAMYQAAAAEERLRGYEAPREHGAAAAAGSGAEAEAEADGSSESFEFDSAVEDSPSLRPGMPPPPLGTSH